jgi:hypothetical protein
MILRALHLAGVASATIAATALPAPVLADSPPKDAAAEAGPPKRPPPLGALEEVEEVELPRSPRLEIGVHALARGAFTRRASDASTAGVGPGPGVSLGARVRLIRHHPAGIDAGFSRSTTEQGPGAIVPGATFPGSRLDLFTFDLLAMPRWPVDERVTLQLFGGIGGVVVDTGVQRGESAAGKLDVPGRELLAFSVPLGVGAEIAIVPGWLSVELAVKAAPTFADTGNGAEPTTTFDGAGRVVPVASLPQIPVWISQTLGLTLLL